MLERNASKDSDLLVTQALGDGHGVRACPLPAASEGHPDHLQSEEEATWQHHGSWIFQLNESSMNSLFFFASLPFFNDLILREAEEREKEATQFGLEMVPFNPNYKHHTRLTKHLGCRSFILHGFHSNFPMSASWQF